MTSLITNSTEYDELSQSSAPFFKAAMDSDELSDGAKTFSFDLCSVVMLTLIVGVLCCTCLLITIQLFRSGRIRRRRCLLCIQRTRVSRRTLIRKSPGSRKQWFFMWLLVSGNIHSLSSPVAPSIAPHISGLLKGNMSDDSALARGIPGICLPPFEPLYLKSETCGILLQPSSVQAGLGLPIETDGPLIEEQEFEAPFAPVNEVRILNWPDADNVLGTADVNGERSSRHNLLTFGFFGQPLGRRDVWIRSLQQPEVRIAIANAWSDFDAVDFDVHFVEPQPEKLPDGWVLLVHLRPRTSDPSQALTLKEIVYFRENHARFHRLEQFEAFLHPMTTNHARLLGDAALREQCNEHSFGSCSILVRAQPVLRFFDFSLLHGDLVTILVEEAHSYPLEVVQFAGGNGFFRSLDVFLQNCPLRQYLNVFAHGFRHGYVGTREFSSFRPDIMNPERLARSIMRLWTSEIQGGATIVLTTPLSVRSPDDGSLNLNLVTVFERSPDFRLLMVNAPYEAPDDVLLFEVNATTTGNEIGFRMQQALRDTRQYSLHWGDLELVPSEPFRPPDGTLLVAFPNPVVIEDQQMNHDDSVDTDAASFHQEGWELSRGSALNANTFWSFADETLARDVGYLQSVLDGFVGRSFQCLRVLRIPPVGRHHEMQFDLRSLAIATIVRLMHETWNDLEGMDWQLIALDLASSTVFDPSDCVLLLRMRDDQHFHLVERIALSTEQVTSNAKLVEVSPLCTTADLVRCSGVAFCNDQAGCELRIDGHEVSIESHLPDLNDHSFVQIIRVDGGSIRPLLTSPEPAAILPSQFASSSIDAWLGWTFWREFRSVGRHHVFRLGKDFLFEVQPFYRQTNCVAFVERQWNDLGSQDWRAIPAHDSWKSSSSLQGATEVLVVCTASTPPQKRVILCETCDTRANSASLCGPVQAIECDDFLLKTIFVADLGLSNLCQSALVHCELVCNNFVIDEGSPAWMQNGDFCRVTIWQTENCSSAVPSIDDTSLMQLPSFATHARIRLPPPGNGPPRVSFSSHIEYLDCQGSRSTGTDLRIPFFVYLG